MISSSALKNLAKSTWIIAVLVFVAVYAFSKREMIAQAASTLTLLILLEAAVLIFLAKLCLMTVMRMAAGRFQIRLTWADCYRIYNLTQVAKYIPGSVWQFVGRIAILRERQVPAEAIRDSLLAETGWVAGSSVLIAAVVVLGYRPAALMEWLASAGVLVRMPWLPLAGGGLILVLLAGALLNKRLVRWVVRLSPPLQVVLPLGLVWGFLGAAFWVTLVPTASVYPSLPYIIGVYCFAYVAGFLVPFAPAGLGIREAVLTMALMPYLGVETAAVMAAINRILYFAVEVFAAGTCLLVKNR